MYFPLIIFLLLLHTLYSKWKKCRNGRRLWRLRQPVTRWPWNPNQESGFVKVRDWSKTVTTEFPVDKRHFRTPLDRRLFVLTQPLSCCFGLLVQFDSSPEVSFHQLSQLWLLRLRVRLTPSPVIQYSILTYSILIKTRSFNINVIHDPGPRHIMVPLVFTSLYVASSNSIYTHRTRLSLEKETWRLCRDIGVKNFIERIYNDNDDV